MVSRRRVVQSGVLVPGATLLSGCATSTVSPVSTATSRSTYVLVPGAWHGGWCWDEVRSLLEANGHRVYTPSLSGLGDRVHYNKDKEIGLETHINDVVNLIKFEELEDVILVGHSYAGVVISGVVDRVKDSIAQLVYLDAIIADDAGSLVDPYGELSDQQVGQIMADVVLDNDRSLPVPGLGFLGLDENHPLADSLLQRLTPHPAKTITDRLRYMNDGPAGVAKSFIYCTEQKQDSVISRKLKKIKNNEEWSYLEIATSHEAMLTEPRQLVELLYQITA